MDHEFQIYKNQGDQFAWRLRAGNGQIIATSGEGYITKADARKGLNAAKAARDGFTVFEDDGKQYRWNLKAGNGQVIATSGEGYVAKADAERGVELFKGSGKAKVIDVSVAQIAAAAAAASPPTPARWPPTR